MIAGLDAPTQGVVRVNGTRYARSRAPMTELGVLLDARAVHPGRSARNHLLAVGQTGGFGRQRVDEVLDSVGLAAVAGKRVGGFSLGMAQRLGIATALLGRPQTIVLDEPVNGLDPDGVRWIRDLLRSLAAEGRTVLVSSHLLTEMAETASRVVVLGRGRLLADCTVAEFLARGRPAVVEVRSADPGRLREVLEAEGGIVTASSADLLAVRGLRTEQVGLAASQAGVPVYELAPRAASLEQAFLSATEDSLEFADTTGSSR
jgi:ABC-2 type transport system ATP-binding protein